MLEDDLRKYLKRFGLSQYAVDHTDNYYDHISFTVNCLSDYVAIISSLSRLENNKRYFSGIYRGTGDCTWKLTPSLLRYIKNNHNPCAVEHDLAVDFLSEAPEIINRSNSSFEKLSSMQHFGIPTRLLDFTTNPLIALYFACAEQPHKTGRVVYTKDRIHHYDDIPDFAYILRRCLAELSCHSVYNTVILKFQKAAIVAALPRFITLSLIINVILPSFF